MIILHAVLKLHQFNTFDSSTFAQNTQKIQMKMLIIHNIFFKCQSVLFIYLHCQRSHRIDIICFQAIVCPKNSY